MHTVAILGAGELGGALARTLAAGDAVSRIVLVDEAGNVAAGKALDIRQTGPVESYDTAVDGSDDIHQASGVDVIVMADRHGQAAPSAEAALALVDRVARLSPGAPLVFSGVADHALMTLAIKELKLSTTRLVGSAPVAVAAAACALCAPALEASPVDVAIPVLGLPPAWVLAWDGARVAGSPVEMPAHAAARVEQTLGASRPGAYSLASAAAAVVRAMLTNSRRRFCCFQATPFGGVHPVVFAAPVTLEPSGIGSVRVPELTPRQRVALESTVLART
jgi:malate dehydrogenase